MRRMLILGSVLVLVAAGAVISYLRSPHDGRTVLAEAIAAHGGAEAIARTRTGHIVGRNEKVGPEGRQSFAWEEFFQAPNLHKRVIEEQERGQKVTTTLLAPAGKCFVHVGGLPLRASDCDTAELASPFDYLTRLVEIYDANLPLLPLGPETIRGRPALGFQADSKDWGKVGLYFDKESKLCVKVKKYPNDDEAADDALEIICSDVKSFDGVQVPVRITFLRNGQMDYELTLHTVQFVPQLGAGTFAVP